MTTEISGKVEDASGNVIQGATVYIVRESDDTIVATESTDSAGEYVVTGLSDTDTYHVTAQYDDGSTKYAGTSYPAVSPFVSDGPIDDFNDGDIVEYSGNKVSYGTQTSIVFEGSHALEMSNDDGASHEIYSLDGDGLPRYPGAGDTFSFRLYFEGPNGSAEMHFAVQNSDTYYRARVVPSVGEISIGLRDSGSLTSFDTGAGTIPTGEWLEGVIEWKTDGDITFTLKDSAGSEIASASGNDSTYTQGGIGWDGVTDSFSGNSVYYDIAEITTVGATVNFVFEDFEDDQTGFNPEGWEIQMAGVNGVSAVPDLLSTTTGNSISGSKSAKVTSGEGYANIGNDAELDDVSAKIEVTQLTGKTDDDGGLQVETSSGRIVVRLNPVSGDVLYTNTGEGITDQIISSGGYTAGNTVTIEIRNLDTGIEVVLDGSVIHTTSQTVSDVSRIKFDVDGVALKCDDVDWRAPTGSNPFTDEYYVVTNGLFNWWPMRTGQGVNVVADYAGADGGSAYRNGASWQSDSGRVGGQVIGFDGDNDYLETKSSPGISDGTANSFSISVWVNWDAATDTIQGIFQSIDIDNDDSSTDADNPPYGMFISTNGGLIMRVQDSSNNFTDTTYSNFPSGVWKHVVWTYDGSVSKIYIDGTEEVSNTLNVSIFDESEAVELGAWKRSDSRFFDGELDSCRLYTRALSSSEVTDIYNAEK